MKGQRGLKKMLKETKKPERVKIQKAKPKDKRKMQKTRRRDLLHNKKRTKKIQTIGHENTL